LSTDRASWAYLENDQEEESIDQDTPDCNIGQNAGSQMMRIDSNGTVPVKSNKCPSQRSGNDWNVDESCVSVMAEIKGRQVEEVDDQDNLSPDEVPTDEEHNECEVEQVVEDEVASDTCCGVHVVGIFGEKVPDISDLEDEEKNPVDGGNDNVQGERSSVNSVYIPNGMAPLLDIISGGVEGVVECGDY